MTGNISSSQSRISLELELNRSYCVTEILNLARKGIPLHYHLPLLKNLKSLRGGNRHYFILPVLVDGNWIYKIFYITQSLEIKTANKFYYYENNNKFQALNKCYRESIAREIAKKLASNNRQWVKGYNHHKIKNITTINPQEVSQSFFDGWSYACSKTIRY